ncbi:MAG: hypothetical protein ACYS47_07680 [Planctomycetota bacterium]
MKNRRTNWIAAGLALVLAAGLGCPRDPHDPAPPPTPAPTAASNTRSLNTVDTWGSAFPSDMELVDTPALRDTLFVNDEATVEAAGGAQILALDLSTPSWPASGQYTGFTLQKTDLLHSGGTPVGAGDTFGAWMLEAKTEDLLVVSGTAGFLLVGQSHEGDAPFLANLVHFDPTTGALLQVVNLAVSYADTGLTRSDGTAIASFVQTNPAGVAFVSTGGSTGKLYVVMSNLYSTTGMNDFVFNPGTVQVFDVLLGGGTPITTPATTVIRPTKWNPVHATPYVSPQTGAGFVLVSNGGITEYYGQPPFGYSPPYQTFSQTESNIEVIDAATDAIVADIPMGLAALSMGDIAIGKDGADRTVGMIGSKFYGHLYAVELTGLDQNPIDTASIKPIRNGYHPIPVFQSALGNDHTWAVDVALSPNGRYAFVGAFNQADVHVVSLPADWYTGTFTVNPASLAAPYHFTALDNGIPNVTRILVRKGDFIGPDVLVLQSNTELSMTPTNLKYAGIGTVDTHGRTK